MLKVRPANERGHANHGWLDTYHTFSCANYYDPQEMGYSCLRVINDDTVAPGMGFGTHGHDNMEIISIVLDGTIEHQDSMGNRTQIKPGDIQRNLTPSYAQQTYPDSERLGTLRLVCSPDSRDGSLVIHQDALPFVSTLKNGERATYALPAGRRAFLHVARATSS